MPLSLRAMRYTQAALRSGNIAAAADAMHVAPSAIAAALSQAESSFGMALATRARAKGIFPTASGRDVLRKIDDLLERYDAMLADVSELQWGLSGNLSIAYNAPIAPAFLPHISARFLAAHPEVSLTFSEGDNTTVRNALLEGQVDVIIFVEELPSPQIETIPLIFAPTYCLCPADWRIAQNGPVSIAQIAREPLILLDRPAARRHYMDLLRHSGEEFRIVATANSTEMTRSLVAAGVGASLLNMRPRKAPSYGGDGIRCIPILGVSSGVTLSLGFAPAPNRRLLKMFVECCTSFFEGPDGKELIVEG